MLDDRFVISLDGKLLISPCIHCIKMEYRTVGFSVSAAVSNFGADDKMFEKGSRRLDRSHGKRGVQNHLPQLVRHVSGPEIKPASGFIA